MYYQRQVESLITEGTKSYPVVMITGPRQVGKTTVFKHLIESERTFISLDDPEIRSFAKQQPKLFFERFKPPLLIDEIQYAPELFPYIKMIVDKENRNGLFWITGSQIFPLMQGVSESLAGRVLLLRLYGLTLAELSARPAAEFPQELNYYLKPNAKGDIASQIIKGSYPRMIVEENISTNGYYSSYVQTYLERDVRSIANISDMLQFNNFIKLLALRSAQELNMASLAKELAVDNTTVKRWLKILELSGIICLLAPYTTNLGKRVIKRPKLYFMDSGLLSYLVGIDSVESYQKSPLKGSLFETFVVTEILKSWWYAGKTPAVYYYRDTRQKEIDIIIERGNQLYPFEIKSSHQPKPTIKQFNVLANSTKEIHFGGIIYDGDNVVPIDEQFWFIPASMI